MNQSKSNSETNSGSVREKLKAIMNFDKIINSSLDSLWITDEKAKMVTGIDKTVGAISSTMGARGKTVGIATSQGELRFTKDGVTVAKSISLEDPIENMGAKMVINSANLWASYPNWVMANRAPADTFLASLAY